MSPDPKHDLRLAAFQRAIPKDRRNEVGRTLVIDRISDQTPVTLFQATKIKKLGREGDLIQRCSLPLRIDPAPTEIFSGN